MKKNVQTVYEDRWKALFRFILRNSDADSFNSLEAGLTWDDVKTQFIDRFVDGKKQ